MGEESSCAILDILYGIDGLISGSQENSVAIVQAGGYKGVDQTHCSRLREELGDLPQVEEGDLGGVFCVCFEGQIAVKDYSQVSDLA